MRKSLKNIKHFMDSNVRQRIDKVANNNCDFLDADLLTVEHQFEDIKQICVETEKRISAMLQSIQVSPLNTYTQNVQAGLNNLSHHSTKSIIMNISNSHSQQANASSVPVIDDINSADAYAIGNLSSKSNTLTHVVSPVTELTNPSDKLNQLTIERDLITTSELRDDIQRHKKLPIVGFLKFLLKSRHKTRQDSLLGTTLTHCSQLQLQLTKLYLSYEQTIEAQILKPLHQVLETDIPNVIKLRKLFIKSHNDLETVKAKHNGASQKQQQQSHTGQHSSTSYTITLSATQPVSTNKLDQLKKELEDAEARFDQARDTYSAELYAFVCRESELVSLVKRFYQYQANYHQRVGQAIESSLPSLSDALAETKRKVVFGTPLVEHLRCANRKVSPVIELCIHLLHSYGLNEEGLFRIPGSSIKIKKLKNAINAWFVTLASNTDLESEQNGQSTLLAINSMFKEILAQSSRPSDETNDITSRGDLPLGLHDSNLTSANSLLNHHQNQQQILNPNQSLIYDLHSVAGLLKLYLRELPEHLFTYALYDDWIKATQDHSAVTDRVAAYQNVLRDLPKPNYDNLHHLIRFLYSLTCHQKLNKMTATNLAIAMAPSLIWSKPVSASLDDEMIANSQISAGGQKRNLGLNSNDSDGAQVLNMQMSNLGISASIHAQVIETFITHAETLLPGLTQFELPAFTVVPSHQRSNLRSERSGSSKRDNLCAKSNSPTGLSTASSSSFTSSSNGSVRSMDDRRRTNSVEGLIEATNVSGSTSISNVKIQRSRPVSVYVEPTTRRLNQPPPVPPAPTRSHIRQSIDSRVVTASPRSSFVINKQKPPAPPVPPLMVSSRCLQATKSMAIDPNEAVSPQPPRAPSRSSKISNERSNDSVRSTGSAAATSSSALLASSSNTLKSLRPSVPPPDRPSKSSVAFLGEGLRPNTCSPEDFDNKSSHSITSSGNFRGDFEEISSNDVEEISVSVSPVASLDSISGGDDSSFNDNQAESPESLDQWTDSRL